MTTLRCLQALLVLLLLGDQAAQQEAEEVSA